MLISLCRYNYLNNNPDRAKMRPDGVLACNDFYLAEDMSDIWKDR